MEIDKPKLIQRLHELGATNLGEHFLRERIFYDRELTWMYDTIKMVRIREYDEHIYLTYKHSQTMTADGTEEIEMKINDADKTELFLTKLGLVMYRRQEKRRHAFNLDDVIVDIDTWPKVPTYVELECPSEEALKNAAQKLGLDWTQAVFENARMVIEKKYNIPVSRLRYFTFERTE